MDFHIIWPRNTADFDYINTDSLNIIEINSCTELHIEFYRYSKSFNLAANDLVEHMINTAEIRKLDLWFFAMVYLYRQSLELMLKSIAFQNIKEKSARKNFISDTRHNLKACFEEISKESNIVNHLSAIEANWINEYLFDITLIDEQSDLFRYPFNNKMESYFEEQTHINIIALYENMNVAYSILKKLYKKYPAETINISFEPKLLIYGGEYYGQSIIGWKYESLAFYPFIEGYIESANYIHDFIVKNIKNNELFFPMCYLYRNGIELSLKRILIEDCNINTNKAAKIIRKKKHSVLGLWNSIKDEIVSNANATEDDKTLQNVEKYINQLHILDQTSDKFRYPVDKNLNMHFQTIKKFDISNVSLCFKELFSFLDAADSMLSQIREFEADMEREMRDYY